MRKYFKILDIFLLRAHLFLEKSIKWLKGAEFYSTQGGLLDEEAKGGEESGNWANTVCEGGADETVDTAKSGTNVFKKPDGSAVNVGD